MYPMYKSSQVKTTIYLLSNFCKQVEQVKREGMELEGERASGEPREAWAGSNRACQKGGGL